MTPQPPSPERVEEIRERRITMLRRLAEFPWKDWDATRVKELVDEQGDLILAYDALTAEVERLREEIVRLIAERDNAAPSGETT